VLRTDPREYTMVTLNPYLSFNGNAREALEFYHSVLGGQLDISTFGEAGMPLPPEADASVNEQVMHGQVTTDDGLVLMASDTPPGMDYVAPSAGITVSYTGGPADHERLATAFEKLSEGGTVGMPLEKAPWGDYFGQLVDRFGISWMVDIATVEAAAPA